MYYIYIYMWNCGFHSNVFFTNSKENVNSMDLFSMRKKEKNYDKSVEDKINFPVEK